MVKLILLVSSTWGIPVTGEMSAAACVPMHGTLGVLYCVQVEPIPSPVEMKPVHEETRVATNR